jgi:hypothetical protein
MAGKVTAETSEQPSRLAELRSSAQGWHGVQLAVLGFIGLCGVLKPEAESAPGWLQALAGIAVVAALAIACLATFLIARVAWPLYRGSNAQAGTPVELARAGHQLTRGLVLTFVAVGLVALASAVSWWPKPSGTGTGTGGGQVEVQTADGQSFCGRLAESRPGVVRIETGDSPVAVAIQNLTVMRSVDSCD